MQSAPAWLSYASPAAALVALLVSLATYYRAGPRVEVDATVPWDWKPSDGDLQVTVVVRNTGLAPIQIVSVRIAARLVTPYLTIAFYVPFSNDDAYDGPDLPMKLEAGHQQTCIFLIFVADPTTVRSYTNRAGQCTQRCPLALALIADPLICRPVQWSCRESDPLRESA